MFLSALGHYMQTHTLFVFLNTTNTLHKNLQQEIMNGHVKLAKNSFNESDYLTPAILHKVTTMAKTLKLVK